MKNNTHNRTCICKDDSNFSLNNCIISSDIHLLRECFKYGIFDVHLLQKNLLEIDFKMIKNEKIADILWHNCTIYNSQILDNFLSLYVKNKWSEQTINEIIKYGANVLEIIKYNYKFTLRLSDDLFFTYFNDILDNIDTQNIHIFVRKTSNPNESNRIKIMYEKLPFTEESLFLCLTNARYNIELTKYFIQFISTNSFFIFSLVMDIISSNVIIQLCYFDYLNVLSPAQCLLLSLCDTRETIINIIKQKYDFDIYEWRVIYSNRLADEYNRYDTYDTYSKIISEIKKMDLYWTDENICKINELINMCEKLI